MLCILEVTTEKAASLKKETSENSYFCLSFFELIQK